MRHHFYHAVTQKGYDRCKNAIEYSDDIWKRAIEDYGYLDKEHAYYSLGRVVHLVRFSAGQLRS